MIGILLSTNARRCSTRRRFNRLVALVALALPLSLLTYGIAVAASPSKIEIRSIGGEPNAGMPQFWTGTVYANQMRIPDVPECRNVSCDHLLLKLELPINPWREQAGGL